MPNEITNNEREYSEIWTKKEYAEMHWQSIKEFIAELDEKKELDARSKMFRILGYIESYEQVDNNLTR